MNQGVGKQDKAMLARMTKLRRQHAEQQVQVAQSEVDAIEDAYAALVERMEASRALAASPDIAMQQNLRRYVDGLNRQMTANREQYHAKARALSAAQDALREAMFSEDQVDRM